MFTLREITERDVTRVVDIIRVAFEEYRGRLDPPSSAHHYGWRAGYTMPTSVMLREQLKSVAP